MLINCCCCLYSKGKNFRANHNLQKEGLRAAGAVVYIAKVRILEQITTTLPFVKTAGALLFI